MSAHPVSIHQLRMLRAIANGQPWDTLHFKTREALLTRGLIYRTDNGRKVYLSEMGRKLVRPLMRDGAPFMEHEAKEVHPVMLDMAPPKPDGFVLVCCDEFEDALRLGLLARSAFGIAFVRTGNQWWRIRYCPWCADMREKSDE
jgi:hypothetical protein